MSGLKLPDHTKIAVLVCLFHEKDEREFKHSWIHNQKSFERARADILGVAVTERLEIMNRGVKDMEVDALAERRHLVFSLSAHRRKCRTHTVVASCSHEMAIVVSGMTW